MVVSVTSRCSAIPAQVSALPELLYIFYQIELAGVTVAILMSALAERGEMLPGMVFAFLWVTLVYCPLACLAWNMNGWKHKRGVLDCPDQCFVNATLALLDVAGGGPVEIDSGVSGLAFSWVLGRCSERELLNFRPHVNESLVCSLSV